MKRRWGRPNVRIKCLKTVTPNGADTDTATTVIGKIRNARVITAGFYSFPDAVFKGAIISSSAAMARSACRNLRCSIFFVKASTALRIAATEISAAYGNCISADATAYPIGQSSFTTVVESLNRQARELRSYFNIFWFSWHRISYHKACKFVRGIK
jgi:hypothetical protein